MLPTDPPPRSTLTAKPVESDGVAVPPLLKSAFFLPALFCLLALSALLVDCRLSQCFIEACPSEIKRIFNFCELFGHGFGVVVIVVLIYQLDPGRRWAIPRVMSVAVAAGLAADVVKMLVERIRPHHFNLENDVLKSFEGWMPLISPSSHQSFPSGHTAMTVGLACGLVWLYPRGRWLFPSLAVLVGFQRLACGAHYLSDVLAGAAVGTLMGILFLKASPICRRFDQWESRSQQPAQSHPS